MITKENLQENAKRIADDVKSVVDKLFQERDSIFYKENALDAIWLNTVHEIFKSFGHLCEELDKDKEKSNLNLRRESVFIGSKIGKEWLETFNKLKKEKNLIIANNLNCSNLIEIEEKLNKHISLRDSLIDKANQLETDLDNLARSLSDRRFTEKAVMMKIDEAKENFYKAMKHMKDKG